MTSRYPERTHCLWCSGKVRGTKFLYIFTLQIIKSTMKRYQWIFLSCWLESEVPLLLLDWCISFTVSLPKNSVCHSTLQVAVTLWGKSQTKKNTLCWGTTIARKKKSYSHNTTNAPVLGTITTICETNISIFDAWEFLLSCSHGILIWNPKETHQTRRATLQMPLATTES